MNAAVQPRALPGAARFVAFRTVPNRGVMTFTLEVPSADGPAAMAYLGSPVPGSSVHVGLVRLGDEGDGAPPVHGTYESCRTVAGRSVLALTIDVPAERSHKALQTLGYPTAGSDIQVAVALLKGEPPPQKLPKEPGAAAVQRAALRPKDPPFQRFMLGPDVVPGDATTNEERTKEAIYAECKIRSRAELKTNPDALAKWLNLERIYEKWLQTGAADASMVRR